MTEAAQFIQDLAVIMIAAAGAGLFCKKAGLSPIVGYLIAGIVVGPHTPPHSFVTDIDRVEVLAQLGMVFVMFGIGLGFSLRRLRQLGLGVIAATVLGAFLMFTLARGVGVLLGLERDAAVFFAAMFLVSSSAVIGKVLGDTGRTHEKSSQLSLGITLSEDIVAIVMLTLLGSYVRFGSDEVASDSLGILPTLGLFGGFVLVLTIVGILVVPRMLQRLSREATAELETIFVAGLLFGLALIVVRAGYSLALGSFLLGAIIGETPQRSHVSRAFGGLQDMFGAIFFVAIGMSIDVSLLRGALVPVAVGAVLALVGRMAALTASMLFVGEDTRTALRAGLIVTPIGEFSFIIAQLGTDGGVLPPDYMGVAVGVSIVTALVSPLLIKHNVALADRLAQARLPGLSHALGMHRRVLVTIHRRGESNILWRLSRRRVVQIAVEVVFVSAALIFARPIIDEVAALFTFDLIPGFGSEAVCWVALGLLLLAPLIAIWRNCQALVMIFADFLSHQSPALARSRAAVTTVLQASALLALLLWLWNLVPAEANLWVTVTVVSILALVAAFLWRRLIRWHSEMEISLESALSDASSPQNQPAWMDGHAPWGLQIGELVLPDRFAWAGRSIGDIGIRTRFGCSVIGIERQGFTIANPGHAAHLFPGDKVLLLGSRQQIDGIREEVFRGAPAVSDDDTFHTLTLEPVEIAPGSPAAGRTLAALNWARIIGIQVVGHERGKNRVITPSGDQALEPGDRLLVLGTPQQFSSLRRQIMPAPRPAP
jgi:CPA2 family monovalent cation:H+ antiporter-2